MTFGRASELYCAEVAAGKPGADAAARECAWLEAEISITKQVREISQSDITQVRNARRVMTTKRGAGKDEQGRPLQKLVSHATVNRTMQMLRAVLYHMRDHHDAFLKPNLKFGITKEHPRKREATEEEEAALIDALREDYHDIFAFALFSGIRETGVCTLEWRNVDLHHGQVTFRSKRRRTDPAGFIRWETQPLGPAELAILQRLKAVKHHPQYVFTYVAERNKRGGKGRSGDDIVVGKRYPITVEALTTRWQRDREKAAKGMPSVMDINWHILRHTFATRLLRKCRNLAYVRDALNHADIATTARFYAHVLNDDVRAAKQEAQDAQQATPTMQKVQGLVQGRPNLKAVS
jgi:integrase